MVLLLVDMDPNMGTDLLRKVSMQRFELILRHAWLDSSSLYGSGLSFSVSSQSQLEPASGMFTFFIRWPIGCFDNRVYDGYRLVPCSLRVLVGIEGVGWPTHHARTFEGLGRTLELSHFQNRHVHQGTNRQSTVWFA